MALLDVNQSIRNAIQWLETALQQLASEDKSPTPSVEKTSPSETSPPSTQANRLIAWGSKVSPEFKKRVLWIAETLGCDPSWLMACMAWESGETFSSTVRNAAGSGAVGLIQFMPTTAIRLGTTTALLAQTNPEDQLRFVYEYFKPMTGKLHNLGDVYMTILWPKAIGKPDSAVLFDRAATAIAYRQNAGLDINHDGSVTRGECLIKIEQKLTKGLSPGYVG